MFQLCSKIAGSIDLWKGFPRVFTLVRKVNCVTRFHMSQHKCFMLIRDTWNLFHNVRICSG